MFCEDDEVVETTDTAEVADSGDAEPAEAVASDSDVSDDPAEAAEAAEESSEEEAPSLFDWNGEVDSLKAAEWLNDLDPSTRATLMRGIEAKYRNFERGYTKAAQENSVRRKSLERKEKDIREQEMRVQKWLHGDVDPLAAKQTEIDDLKRMHEVALEALRREHEEASNTLQHGRADELEKLMQERDSALQRVGVFEQQVAAQEKAKVEAEVDEFETWLKDKAPHVYSDEKALYALCVQVASGIARDDALSMVLGKYAAPAPEPEPEPVPTPDPVPESVDMMNMGSSAASTEPVEVRSFDDLMDSLRRQAVEENNSRLNQG